LPAFLNRYTTVLFNHVGAGISDLSKYSFSKHDQLENYVEDIVDIARKLKVSNAVLLGIPSVELWG